MIEINYRTEFPVLLKVLGLEGHACEVGNAEGRFSEVLIQSPQITKLFMIDAWQTLNQPGDGGYPQSWHDNNWKEIHERVEPWKEKAIFLKGLSGQMIKQIPDDSLVLAYIDCDHSYEGFTNDLIGVLPKVKSGGIVAGHDVLNPTYGVGRALSEWGRKNGYVSGLGSDFHYTEEDGDASMVSFWFIKK